MVALKERLEKLGALPALPSTVVRLLQGLNDPSKGADELEEILRTDEAVAAAVLRKANSAGQGGGGGGRVFTLQESVARLGARNLQQLAVTMQCGTVLETHGGSYGLERGALWEGALAGAIAAEEIAKETGLEDPGTCFVAALLRDIGKIAMDEVFDRNDLGAVFAAGGHERPQIEVEREVLGIDHAELGAMLAECWDLPDRLAQTIRYHHAPSEMGEGRDPLVDIVHIADMVCVWLGMGVGEDGLCYRVDPDAQAAIGIDRRQVEEYMVRVQPRLQALLAELRPDGVAGEERT